MKPGKKRYAKFFNERSYGSCRSLENLGIFVKRHSIKVFDNGDKEAKTPLVSLPEGLSDQALFREAMSDVIPIKRNKHYSYVRQPLLVSNAQDDNEEHEAVACLRELVDSGKGFVVSDTAEYMEGVNYQSHPEILQRLHRGDFSVQAVIDLHGCSVLVAGERFDAFIRESIALGRRSVLVVHGRGLSSPDKPVLKSKVKEWLTSGMYKRWVIAFSSARLCDGGAGATCILLRKSSLPGNLKKRKKQRL